MDAQIDRTDHAAAFLAPAIHEIIVSLPRKIKTQAQEIRLRVDNPLCIHTGRQHLFIKRDGGVVPVPDADCYKVTAQEMEESFRRLCGYSVHSHQNEIADGYLSVEGGHRVGLCGRAVRGDGSGITGLRDITSLNLRIAREIRGAADELMSHIAARGLGGLILVGSPSSGKTTLLRDLARQLSGGRLGIPLKVAVIDERGELSAMHNGHVQNDLGPCTDILCGVSKSEGILMAVRTLSPQVILCDEIGSMQEIAAVEAGLNCGASVITTLHAHSWEELRKRPQFLPLIQTGAFEQVVLLQGAQAPSTIESIREVGEWYDQTDRHGAGDFMRLGWRNDVFAAAHHPGT